MFSCRPNPVIKFYLNKNHSSTCHQPTKDTVTNLNKINPEQIALFTDFLEDHRRNIILDYKKKLEEVKGLKKRFSVQSSQRNNTYYMRVKTSREPSEKQKQRTANKKRSYRSTEIDQNSVDSSMRVNTINFSLNGIQPYDTGEKKVAPLRETVTTFQRCTLKRLKAQESMMIKKKRISHEIDQRHYEQVEKAQERPCEVKSFRVFTESHV